MTAVEHTPRELSAIARRVFRTGPLSSRLLQRYRPYICPFDAVLAQVPVRQEGWRALDIGCGGGLWLVLLAATGRLRGGRGVGFDASHAAIDMARAAAGTGEHGREPTLEFHQLDAREPWPPGAFDLVSLIDVAHHIPPSAQESVIREAARRVEPGGRFIYKDMGARPAWRAWANRLHDLVLARQWIHSADLANVERAATSEGLRLVHRARINRWWYAHDLLVFERPA